MDRPENLLKFEICRIFPSPTWICIRIVSELAWGAHVNLPSCVILLCVFWCFYNSYEVINTGQTRDSRELDMSSITFPLHPALLEYLATVLVLH